MWTPRSNAPRNIVDFGAMWIDCACVCLPHQLLPFASCNLLSFPLAYIFLFNYLSCIFSFENRCCYIRYMSLFSARCNIYISRLCYDVSVRLSVRLSVTEMHWRIIANLGFKFRSQFTAHCGRGACGRDGRDHRREEWRDHLALC